MMHIWLKQLQLQDNSYCQVSPSSILHRNKYQNPKILLYKYKDLEAKLRFFPNQLITTKFN